MTRRARLSVLLAAAGIVAGGAAMALLDRSGPQPPPAVADHLVAEPVAVSTAGFRGHDGDPLGADFLEGRWTLLTLGFTSCPDVCPATLARLSEAAGRVAEAGGVPPRLLFVTVDPERDSLEALSAYVGYFSEHLHGARAAEPAALARLEGSLGASHRIEPHQPGEYYSVSHSAHAFVIDPRGRLFARLAPPFRVGEVATALAGLRDWYARAHTAGARGTDVVQKY